jgi:phage recombination protein Bet
MNTQQNQSAPVATRPTVEEREVSYRAFGSDVTVKLSMGIVRKYLCKPTKKGVQPSDADCMNFMMMCSARALNPFERDAFLVGYDSHNGPEFSIITAISAFQKRAEASDDFDGIESGVIVKDAAGAVVDREGDFMFEGDEVLGGWAKVHRKNLKYPFKARLNLRNRYKDNKFWNDDRAGMIVKCAEADALRMAFPTKLGGLYIESEARERDVTPPETTSPKIGSARPAVLGGGSPLNAANFTESRQQATVPVEAEEAQREPQPEQECEPETPTYSEADRQKLFDELQEIRGNVSMADFKKRIEALGFELPTMFSKTPAPLLAAIKAKLTEQKASE